MKTAFVFSGQGAQFVGMGKDLVENSAAAGKIFEKADKVLPWSVSGVCFEGPEEKLRESRYCQVAVFTTSMACLAAFQEKYPEVTPVGCAGLSLGEYGALCCASYFTFEDALRLLARRAELMDEACRKVPGTMASILTNGSVGQDVFEKICSDCGIYVANFNSPAQIVISGCVDGVAKAAELFKAVPGVKRVVPLNVAGAFHSGLMAEAGEALRPVLAEVSVQAPRIPVAQNVTGMVTEDPVQIKENLVRQVPGSVQWVSCVNTLSALGAEAFIEFGPGTVLSGLIRKIDSGKKVMNVSAFADLEKIEL